MESWFVRHTDRMRVIDEAIDYLVDKNKMAIHFPESKRLSEDLTSLDAEDYQEERAKRAVKTFSEMNTKGSYVWAQYRPTQNFPGLRIIVGKVLPGSFELHETRWNDRDRIAKLKTLQITQARHLLPEAKHLQVARPRRGTLTGWHKIGDGLANFVEGKPREKIWSSLSDEEQNAVCLEYLRDPESREIPILRHELSEFKEKRPNENARQWLMAPYQMLSNEQRSDYCQEVR